MNLGDASSTFFYCTYLEPCQSSALFFPLMAPKKSRFASWEAAAKTPMELRLQSGLVDSGGSRRTQDTRPGKLTKSHGKPPFWMGKLTISMAIFNSYVSLPEGISVDWLVHGVGLGETWRKKIAGTHGVPIECGAFLQLFPSKKF